MRIYLVISFLLVLGNLPVWSQKHSDVKATLGNEKLHLNQTDTNKTAGNFGKKYLVLDASPLLGGFHRYRFFPGDNIKFRMKNETIKFNETIRFNETIAGITDSSFTIGTVNEAVGRMNYQEIMLKDIRQIKVSRRIPFVSEASYYFPIAGLLYIGADFFNKGIDNKRFTTGASSLIIGGVLMATGFICYKISFAPHKINRRNKLKVLESY